MNRTIVLVGLAVLLLIAVYAFVDQNQSSETPTGVPVDAANQDVPTTDLIVYVCSTQFEGSDETHYNICVTSKDGTIQRQVTFDRNGEFTHSPRINARGDVAYSCRLKLCIVNIDGSDRRGIDTANYPVATMDINDSGQIMGICLRSEVVPSVGTLRDVLELTLCAINLDEGDFQLLDSFRASPARFFEMMNVLQLSNLGRVATPCLNHDTSTLGICLHDFSDQLVWSKQEDERFVIKEYPVMNESGLIAFACQDPSHRWFICRTSDLSDSGIVMIAMLPMTNDERPYYRIDSLSINNEGTVAFLCHIYPGPQKNLCVIKPDQGIVIEIQNPEISMIYSTAQIDSNNVIFAICYDGGPYRNPSICRMDLDGDNFRRLELQFPVVSPVQWPEFDVQ